LQITKRRFLLDVSTCVVTRRVELAGLELRSDGVKWRWPRLDSQASPNSLHKEIDTVRKTVNIYIRYRFCEVKCRRGVDDVSFRRSPLNLLLREVDIVRTGDDIYDVLVDYRSLDVCGRFMIVVLGAMTG
jgi:hypothetical protein